MCCAEQNIKKKRNETLSKAVSPVDGPVAVTGASGYIGSWCVYDLMESGYNVRACVRDKNKPEKCDHLTALNDDPTFLATRSVSLRSFGIIL